MSERHLARIIRYLVEGSLSSISFFFEFFLIRHGSIIDAIFFFGTVPPVHIPELVECEYLTILSDPSIAVDDRSRWITDPDSHRYDYE